MQTNIIVIFGGAVFIQLVFLDVNIIFKEFLH